MVRYIKFLSLFLCFSVLCSTKADAQFFKKLFGRGKKEQASKQIVKDTATIQIKDAKNVSKIKNPYKGSIYQYPKSVQKENYRVDVLMPLFLDESVVDNNVIYKSKLPTKLIPSLYIYEGLLIALDTLKNKGYNIDVHIHDITNQSNTPEMLIKTGVLDETDLILGAVQSNDIPEIADFAKENEVNFVSVLSPSDADVVDNPFFIMIQPTLETHCKFIVKKIYQKYGSVKPIMLYRDNNDLDNGAYSYMKKDKSYTYQEFNCNAFPDKARLEESLYLGAKNIIVVPIIDPNYSDKLLKLMQDWFPNHSFEVWGMPSWKKMNGINDPNAYPNTIVYITHPFYFDNSTGYGKSLSEKYLDKYGDSSPNELVFRGYELAHLYFDLLSKHGRYFNRNINYNITPFTRFDIKSVYDDNGQLLYMQNQHLYLYRYQSSSFIVEH